MTIKAAFSVILCLLGEERFELLNVSLQPNKTSYTQSQTNYDTFLLSSRVVLLFSRIVLEKSDIV